MSLNKFPSHLKYTKDHEWVETSSKNPKIGVTTFAVEQLGDIVHLDLPKIGLQFKLGDSFGTIESTKTVSDLYMPLSGKVININEEALKKPEILQTDPYSLGWLIEIEPNDEAELIKLMSDGDYEKYLRDSAE
jgi:glycine cleavage system H protein